ncbi:MAG TPA: phasin family protein [Terriglobia bacterium]|nr:phasin family protein [Terriglobia bacterium]
MSVEKPVKQSATAPAITPFTVDMEWAKPFTDAPSKLIAEQLNFAARRLHAQADFLQSLADFQNPAELFQRQTKFLQIAVEDYSNEAARIWRAAHETSLTTQPQT